MLSKVTTMLKAFDRSYSERSNWVEKWDECYNLAMPGRIGFYDSAEGQTINEEIFDSTAVTSVAEFASRMQAGMTPAFGKWFEFAAGSAVPEDQRSDVDEQLQVVAEYVWETLNQSNFNQEIHESYLDLAVGTAVLAIEEGDAITPIRFTSIPQQQVVLSNGPFGTPDKVYRFRSLSMEDILVIWPKAKISAENKSKGEKDPAHKFPIVECVRRDWEYRTTERYEFMVAIKDPEDLIFEGEFKGSGSNPMLPFRWSKASGETYGRGPLFNSLPDIKTLNAVVELGLENLAMAVTGMWQADDDGVINPDTIQLIAGTIIPRSPNSRGLEPLNPPGNFEAAQFILKEMRFNVQKALFNQTLGAPNAGTPASATEINERMADLSRTIGSAFGRLHTEMATPTLKRVVHILQKQGKIDIPIVDGKQVKIVNVSPLAQAQHNEDVARVARWLQLLNGGFGPQMTNTVVKASETAVYAGQKIGVPEKLIRDAGEAEALQQQALEQTTEVSPEQANAQQLG
tara:strand:+ start:12559 stop:14100 length:1542 start_codon:yes stop_codon:yes gene_type:complete